jgi:hypothetical protein
MKTSDAIDQLFTALAAAQGEMKDATFNRENPHFKSQYADFSAIREATRVLSKHGIAVTQGPQQTPEGWMYQSTLVHGKSGQWVEHELPITLGTPQQMGSLMTYLKRYLLSGQTAVAADADDDGEVAEASASQGGASNQTLGEKTLSKAKSRPVYDALTVEMRAISTTGQLQTWGLTNSSRIHSMHKDFQDWFLRDYKDHRTAILEGANEEGETIGEKIDDEIPEAGGSET